MTAEWEKQILAYSMRVSRGVVRKGYIKMSVFDNNQAPILGGVTAFQLVDIISYISRLHKNLVDPIRRRGFGCTIEIGSKVEELLTASGYHLDMFQDFEIGMHDGYAHEIKFCFTHEPTMAPIFQFEDVDINESMNRIENECSADANLEALINKKILEEYNEIDFIDPPKTQPNTKITNKKTKSS